MTFDRRFITCTSRNWPSAGRVAWTCCPPCRRRGPELCGQRADFAGRALRKTLDSTGRRRCRWRRWLPGRQLRPLRRCRHRQKELTRWSLREHCPSSRYGRPCRRPRRSQGSRTRTKRVTHFLSIISIINERPPPGGRLPFIPIGSINIMFNSPLICFLS